MTNPFLDPDYPLDVTGGTVIRGKDITVQDRTTTSPPSTNTTTTVKLPTASGAFTIEQILSQGTPKTGNNLADALEAAQTQATPNGIVLTMPELIAAKITAAKETKKGGEIEYDFAHQFWQDYHDVTTEEYLGTTPQGKPIVLVLHGTTLFTPERIKESYGSLINGAAPLTQDEWKSVLQGNVLSYNEFTRNTPSALRGYGVVLDLADAKADTSGGLTEQAFTANRLAIARCGGQEAAHAYFKRANREGTLGNYHPFASSDATKPQGRWVFLDSNDGGLIGYNNLNYFGRFVGVAPEARSARQP